VWIKGKRDAPFAVGQREAQLFHIHMLRAVQCVTMGPSELWVKAAEQQRERSDLLSHPRGPGVPFDRFKLSDKIFIILDIPVHDLILS
jgi:hypothetical protein